MKLLTKTSIRSAKETPHYNQLQECKRNSSLNGTMSVIKKRRRKTDVRTRSCQDWSVECVYSLFPHILLNLISVKLTDLFTTGIWRFLGVTCRSPCESLCRVLINVCYSDCCATWTRQHLEEGSVGGGGGGVEVRPLGISLVAYDLFSLNFCRCTIKG